VATGGKHIGWYVRDLPGGEAFRQQMNRLEHCDAQLTAVDRFFQAQSEFGERLQYGRATIGRATEGRATQGDAGQKRAA